MRLEAIRSETEKLRIDSGFFSHQSGRAEALVRSWNAGFIELGKTASSLRKGIFDIKATSYEESGVPFIRISNLKSGIIADNNIAFISRETHESEQKTEVVFGDLVISKTAFPAVSLVQIEKANVSQDIIAYKLHGSSRTSLTPAFVSLYLNSTYGIALMQRQFQGNVQLHLSLDDIRKVPIPLFSMRIQGELQQMVFESLDASDQANTAHQEAQSLLESKLGLGGWEPPDTLAYERSLNEVRTGNRFDSQYYDPKYGLMREQLASNSTCKSLRDLGIVEKGWNVDYADEGNLKVIRSGDLSNIDSDTHFLRSDAEEFYCLQPGDVLISSIGFGSIGKVQVFDLEGRYGTVSEVTVVRQHAVDPYYLATFLRTEAGQLQFEQYITGATGQLHLYPKDVRNVVIPILSTEVQQECRNLSIVARQSRQRATELLDRAKRAVDIAIEQSEQAALVYLEQR